MIEVECSTQSNGVILKGTACLPAQSGLFPVVLMIHGSGPLDRDENIKGQGLNIFNAIAHHLAENGFASVRYDKRGCGESEGDYHSTGHFDLVDDAINWLDALSDLEFCDPKKIFLLGHSEGCIIAPQVNIKRPVVAGMILLCPFIESMEITLKKQAKTLQQELDSRKGFFGILGRLYAKMFGQPVDSQNKLIAKIGNSTTDYFYIRFQKIAAKWFRELLTLDPPKIYEKVSAPILAIAGEKDIQCQAQDADEISRVVDVPIDVHVISNLTHILRCDTGIPRLENYSKQLEEPVDMTVLTHISSWLTKQRQLSK